MTQPQGFSLLEVVIVMAIAGILSAVVIPRGAAFLDSIRVHSAASDAFAIFSSARSAAVTRGAQAIVDIDTARAVLSVRIGPDTVRLRELGKNHDVKISANRTSTTYATNGSGYGAGNLTLVIKRGSAVDSLVVSRLGRVRH
jgi:prepilin-type N-terminal cleavage/methylation domain-containing protein